MSKVKVKSKPKVAVTVTHLGCPGHFIAASSCNWRRHTQVVGPGGAYRVSSVGDYYYQLPGEKRTRQALGAFEEDFFETMVFALVPGKTEGDNEGCGCLSVVGWSELATRRYPTAGTAQAGHEAMVKKYTKLAREGGK